VFRRNNWTGTGAALDDIGLVSVVHQLLATVYMRVHPLPRKTRQLAATEEVDQAEAEESEAEDWVGTAAGQEGGPKDENDAEDPSRIWQEERQQQVATTQVWLAAGTVQDDIFIARTVHKPVEAYILDQLRITGVEWEHKQE